MDGDRLDDLPELDADVVAPDGPAMATDGRLHHDDEGPELDLDHIKAPTRELVLEVDDAPPPVVVPPPSRQSVEAEPAPKQSLIAQARESLRADSGRLLRTGLKAAAWLGIGSFLIGQTGLLAALVGGALAGDMVIWFVIRAFELPKHLWAFQFEALLNLGAVWLMVDVMHLFDTFRDPQVLPFGLATFMLMGLGRFAVWWWSTSHA